MELTGTDLTGLVLTVVLLAAGVYVLYFVVRYAVRDGILDARAKEAEQAQGGPAGAADGGAEGDGPQP
ncbi:hypothetical protein [Puerhibacterium puerhi]|uniref:hypothetical protein n=1 Tax=Puerhibacterium puerhi TaxID=2692623 RepID=UPI00135973E1|nr:hypothetical protein [Puerhibacterium puerhi]